MIEEYEHHIYLETIEMKTVCGLDKPMKFCFMSIDHAFLSLKENSRLFPCPKCWKEVIRVFTKDLDD